MNPRALLRSSWLLFRAQLVRILFSRRALLAGLVAASPIAPALLVLFLSEHEGAPPALIIGWLLLVQVVVPLVALILGAGAVAEEVQDRTVTYLFTRPMPRSALLFGRWLAALVWIEVLLAASGLIVVALLAAATDGNAEMAMSAALGRRLVLTLLLGGAVYSGLFAALGAWIRYPVIVGVGYVFAIEGLLGNLPGKNQALTIQYYLKSFWIAAEPEAQARLFDFGRGQLETSGDAVRTLAYVLVIALALGAWILSRRQIELPS